MKRLEEMEASVAKKMELDEADADAKVQRWRRACAEEQVALVRLRGRATVCHTTFSVAGSWVSRRAAIAMLQ